MIICSSTGRRFNGSIERTEEAQLRGVISVGLGNNRPVGSKFAGVEHLVRLSDRPALSELFENSHWPWNSDVRADGTYFHEKSKAFAHGAAYFHSGAESPAANVRGTWAVFLPIDLRLELDSPWLGNADVNLTLHGYFFVDAGRRHVQFAGETHSIESEEALQSQWNRRLRDEIVLPLVIPAFAQFVSDNGSSFSEIAQLTKAIQHSHFFHEHRSSLCRSEQFVPKFTREGINWCRVDSRPVYALPTPPTSRPGAAWEVFPSLEGIDECIVAAGEPLLAHDTDYTSWPTELLRVLCDTPFDDVVADPDMLDFFVDAWQFVTKHCTKDSLHRTHLRDALRRMFAEVPLQHVLQNADKIQRLVSCLRPEDCVGVPTPNNSQPATDVLQNVYRQVLSAMPLPDILLPEGFTPTGKLTPSDARSLLHVLAKGPVGSTPGTNYFLWRSKTACCIFANLTAVRISLRSEFANHRWFPVVLHAAGDAKAQLGSVNDFLAASSRDVLFIGNRQTNEWATEMQSALADRPVLVIEPHVAELLAPDYQPRHICLEEIVSTIGKHHPLAEPENRASLIRHILHTCNDVTLATPPIKSAVRFLLHGQPEVSDEEQKLLVEPDAAIEPVWSKLMDQIRQTTDAKDRPKNNFGFC
jgi:hypothetical protein